MWLIRVVHSPEVSEIYQDSGMDFFVELKKITLLSVYYSWDNKNENKIKK